MITSTLDYKCTTSHKVISTIFIHPDEVVHNGQLDKVHPKSFLTK